MSPSDDLSGRLAALALPEHAAGAELILARRLAGGGPERWRPPRCAQLRAVFVLPTQAYLGVGSWCDELELLDQTGEVALELVAFEVEKLARLILKGHRPTLDWLGSGEVLIHRDGAVRIEAMAALRREELAGLDPEKTPPPVPLARYESLDTWVREMRSGRFST